MFSIRRILQLVVALVVMGLSANYVANGGRGYGVGIHAYVYYGALAASLAIPLFWAVMHMCGGILFGLAGKGLLDGMRMGFLLGMGMALGKLWLTSVAIGAGIFVGRGQQVYAIMFMAAGVVLFALDKTLQYFWKSIEHGRENG